MLVCIIGQRDCSMITIKTCLTQKESQMLELIKQLFDKWSCHHDWELWETVHVSDDWGGSWRVFHFKCKKCGKFKKVK